MPSASRRSPNSRSRSRWPGAYYRVVCAEARRCSAPIRAWSARASCWRRPRPSSSAGRVSQLDVFRAQQLVAQAEGSCSTRAGGGRGRAGPAALPDRPRRRLRVRGRATTSRARRSSGSPSRRSRSRCANRLGAARGREQSPRGRAGQRAFTSNQLLPQLDVNLALTRRGTAADSFRDSFGFDDFRFATFFAVSMPERPHRLSVELQQRADRARPPPPRAHTLRKRVVDEARRAVRELERLMRALEVADQSVAVRPAGGRGGQPALSSAASRTTSTSSARRATCSRREPPRRASWRSWRWPG